MGFRFLIRTLMSATPLIVVCVIGVAFAMIHLNRWPTPARLMLVSCLTQLVIMILVPLVRFCVPEVDRDSIHFLVLDSLDAAKSLLNAAAIAALLWAVIADREPELPELVIDVPPTEFAAAQEQLAEGEPLRSIESNLEQQGLSPESIAAIKSRLTQVANQGLLAAGRKTMELGGWWCLGGVGATSLGQVADYRIGGKYVLAYCAIVYGICQVVSGMRQFYRAKYGSRPILDNPDPLQI